MHLPALVYLDTSKSCTSSPEFLKMYSKGSEIICFRVWVFPHPDAATLMQNKFKTEGLVKNQPFVVGPRHEEINGNKIPICNSTGELNSFANKL